MVDLSIEMLPESGSKQYAYNYAGLHVLVKLGHEFDMNCDYSFLVYAEDLTLMDGVSTRINWEQVWREGHTFTIAMRYYTLWIPGKYFFLMAVKGGGTIRIDLELDEKCQFTAGEPHRCEPHGDEDVLAHQAIDDGPCRHPSACKSDVPWLEDRTLDQVMRGVFSDPDVSGIDFTPAAVDKICRLLTVDSRRNDLCSSHYYAVRLSLLRADADEYCYGNFLIDADDIDPDWLIS